jgi:hypothetical protein
MRHLIGSLLCVAVGVVACVRTSTNPKLKFDSQEVLCRDAAATVTVTTHYKDDWVMGLPVWQVWSTTPAGGEPTPLFTVERAFQESEPGFPLFDNGGGEPIIRDESSSYVYSLRGRAFKGNKFPQSVYEGRYPRSAPASR